MDPNTFGSYLKYLRKEEGYTLEELSDVIGYSQPYLSQIESGHKGIPKPEMLKKLSVVYAIPYMMLLEKAGYIDKNDDESITDGKIKVKFMILYKNGYTDTIIKHSDHETLEEIAEVINHSFKKGLNAVIRLNDELESNFINLVEVARIKIIFL